VKPRLRVTLWRIAFVVAGVCALSGCAHHYVPSAIGDPYGFFSGVWHGFVFPYALVGSVISWSLALVDINFLSSVELVGRPNTGFFFYYVGYLVGLSSYAGATA
jgi:hypothetical protein